MDIFEQTKQFRSITDSIKIDKYLSIRDIYNFAQVYVNGQSELPIEVREHDLKNIMVNYIRHNLIHYSEGLRQVKSINNKYEQDNYVMYKNAVLDKISKEYPFLSIACKNQKRPLNIVIIKGK